jgi:hypothetical protein
MLIEYTNQFFSKMFLVKVFLIIVVTTSVVHDKCCARLFLNLDELGLVYNNTGYFDNNRYKNNPFLNREQVNFASISSPNPKSYQPSNFGSSRLLQDNSQCGLSGFTAQLATGLMFGGKHASSGQFPW